MCTYSSPHKTGYKPRLNFIGNYDFLVPKVKQGAIGVGMSGGEGGGRYGWRISSN